VLRTLFDSADHLLLLPLLCVVSSHAIPCKGGGGYGGGAWLI
jgi:hypothetical protein